VSELLIPTNAKLNSTKKIALCKFKKYFRFPTNTCSLQVKYMWIMIWCSTAEQDGAQVGRSYGDMGLCCIQLSIWQTQTDTGADIDTRDAAQIRPGREKWLHWLWKCTAVDVFYLLCLSNRRFMYSVCFCLCFYLSTMFALQADILTFATEPSAPHSPAWEVTGFTCGPHSLSCQRCIIYTCTVRNKIGYSLSFTYRLKLCNSLNIWKQP
jgi:hypothetical protein